MRRVIEEPKDNSLVPSDLLERTSLAAYATDRARRIVAWNRQAEELSGWSRGYEFGRMCTGSGMQHCDETGRVLCCRSCPLSRTIIKGKAPIASTQVFMRTADDSRRAVFVRFHPLRDRHGQTIGAIQGFDTDDLRLDQHWPELVALPELDLEPTTGCYGPQLLGSFIRSWRIETQLRHVPFGVIAVDGRATPSLCRRLVPGLTAAYGRSLNTLSPGPETLILLNSEATSEDLIEIRNFAIRQAAVLEPNGTPPGVQARLIGPQGFDNDLQNLLSEPPISAPLQIWSDIDLAA